jgi:beta-glucosidase
LIAGAGFDLYRFSTSWARVMPEGRGAVNAQGLDFYDRLVEGCWSAG